MSQQENQDALPEISFSTFVLSLASSALSQLGEVPHPETGKKEVNLTVAAHTIDILDMLDDKLKNGATEEEAKLLQGLLYELRMKYLALKK